MKPESRKGPARYKTTRTTRPFPSLGNSDEIGYVCSLTGKYNFKWERFILENNILSVILGGGSISVVCKKWSSELSTAESAGPSGSWQ